jgi:hypothetical protein
VALRLARRGTTDERAARRIRRAERLVRREIGPSVPKRRAAALLGVSVPGVQRWIDAGRLPVLRRPGGRQEVEARALLDVLEEVRHLREDEGVSRGVLAEAFRRLEERGLPRPNLRPNPSPRELRASYLNTTPIERLEQVAELSEVATTLSAIGAEARRRRTDDGD